MREPEDHPRQTLSRAIVEWGEDQSIRQCVEEMGELIAAFNHFRRGKIGINQLRKEIADVHVCIEQMKIWHGPTEISEIEDAIIDDLLEQMRTGNVKP